MSLPMQGEWIEINIDILLDEYNKSLPMQGEWIEIKPFCRKIVNGCKSLPMQGEWIEISIFSGIPL